MNDFIVTLMLLGAVSGSDGYLPFWMTANQYGLMPERNGALALIQAGQDFDDSMTWQFRWGASAAVNTYNDPMSPASSPVNLMIDQLFGSVRWKALTLDLGQRRREMDFIGADPSLGSLSVTGGHVVESGNARTMPGALVTLDPVAVPLTRERLWIFGAFGDYATMDRRFMQDALVHRTRMGARLDITRRLSLSASLDHYALWAGTSQDGFVQPHSLSDYFRVITGRSAGSTGTISDQVNVIGDQGGSEIFRADWRGNGWHLTLQHDIPYSDASGMKFYNFPDGINTLHFGWDDKDRWVSDLLYEYHYTMYQSGPINGEIISGDGDRLTPEGVNTKGKDKYFWNDEYKSCWTHYGRMICSPLFLPAGVHDRTWSSVLMNLDMENNRFKAHHFGMGGKLWKKHPYRFMLTWSRNHGTYNQTYVGENPADKPWGSVQEVGLDQLSAAFTGRVSFKIKGLSMLYGLYLDQGELYNDSVGATLGIRYDL